MQTDLTLNLSRSILWIIQAHEHVDSASFALKMALQMAQERHRSPEPTPRSFDDVPGAMEKLKAEGLHC